MLFLRNIPFFIIFFITVSCGDNGLLNNDTKANYKISISNQIFNKIKFYKKHHSHFQTMIVIAISSIDAFFRMTLFYLLSTCNIKYLGKAQAYKFALPKLFNPPKSI